MKCSDILLVQILTALLLIISSTFLQKLQGDLETSQTHLSFLLDTSINGWFLHAYAKNSGFLYNNKNFFETYEQALLCLQKNLLGDVGISNFLTTFLLGFFKLQINPFVYWKHTFLMDYLWICWQTNQLKEKTAHKEEACPSKKHLKASFCLSCLR